MATRLFLCDIHDGSVGGIAGVVDPLHCSRHRHHEGANQPGPCLWLLFVGPRPEGERIRARRHVVLEAGACLHGAWQVEVGVSGRPVLCEEMFPIHLTRPHSATREERYRCYSAIRSSTHMLLLRSFTFCRPLRFADMMAIQSR